MAFAPDKNHPYPKPKEGGNGGGGNKDKDKGPTLKFGFMPGQISGLADDMMAGYGGSEDKWKGYLNDIYSPVRVPSFNFGGGNGGGNNNGPDTPEIDPGVDHGHGGVNGRQQRAMAMPTFASPDRAQMNSPLAQGLLNVGPSGQRLPPTIGLLGNPQQRAPARTGMLPPEIQALLSQRR